MHESLFVGYMWQNPSLYGRYRVHKITKETFTESIWWFYYHLGKEMYENSIRSFDDVTVYSFVNSRPSQKGKPSYLEAYNNFGAYTVIEELAAECAMEKENDEYHFREIQKYETLRKLQKKGFIDVDNEELINKLISLDLETMQSYYQFHYKDSFSHINSGEVIEYNLIDDLDETIERLKAGEEVGIPFFDSPLLNEKINGQMLGNLTYLVFPSGVGKSSFVTEKAILGLLDSGEKGIIFANEEGAFRWRARLLATVAARKINKPVHRGIMNKGGFSEEVENSLRESAEWLKQHIAENIKFIQLKKYRVEDVINRIELYRPLGYNHIFFDTFKPDQASSVERWLAFSNSAQNLYDCIKEEASNCATLATVQLKIGKEYRYIDLDCIGKSGEIVEVASVVMAGRRIFADEYPGENNALKVFNYVWDEIKRKNVWMEVDLQKDKNYIILFFPKNRFGPIDLQLVYEINLDFNTWIEVGQTSVPNTGR